MRYLLACMLLCLTAGYSQEATEAPVEVTIADETTKAEGVEASDSLVNWSCGCGEKNKGSKSK